MVQPFSSELSNLKVQIAGDVASAVADTLRDYAQRDIEHSFVVSASLYAETDLLDLFYFHKEARQTVTRAKDCEGLLDLWVVNCANAAQENVTELLLSAKSNAVSYFIREYVIRLTHPRDLRKLASDVLRGSCSIRPSGQEIKPGIWLDDGAEIHRRARIVAPAYIGRRKQSERRHFDYPVQQHRKKLPYRRRDRSGRQFGFAEYACRHLARCMPLHRKWKQAS